MPGRRWACDGSSMGHFWHHFMFFLRPLAHPLMPHSWHAGVLPVPLSHRGSETGRCDSSLCVWCFLINSIIQNMGVQWGAFSMCLYVFSSNSFESHRSCDLRQRHLRFRFQFSGWKHVESLNYTLSDRFPLKNQKSGFLIIFCSEN